MKKVIFISCFFVLLMAVVIVSYYFTKSRIQRKGLAVFLDYCATPQKCTVKRYLEDKIEVIEVNKDDARVICETLKNNIKSGMLKYYDEDTFEYAPDYILKLESSDGSCIVKFLNDKRKGVVMYNCRPSNKSGTIILNMQSASNISGAIKRCL